MRPFSGFKFIIICIKVFILGKLLFHNSKYEHSLIKTIVIDKILLSSVLLCGNCDIFIIKEYLKNV